MSDRQSILISIRQKYVESIINGKKRAEIRRMFPDGVSRVYVYVPTPKRHVIGFFEVKEVHRLPVAQLWKQVGRISALSQDYFFAYLSGKEVGTSIYFDEFTVLPHSTPLAELRQRFPKFHPPQSFMYVSEDMEKLLLR
ncbi:ASCH domain-containing protein [Desulfovibrio desulfuricans]|uniref:ASCH domain-containing protein n=1 Tax=Desulfovibrio desulfuricans TaxID=876 RepID=A0A4P7UIS7_DESDE|nr:ASCH domain-containing protein [Desulfovibrio desulfuricans]QCC84674.1 ASCH domain-containing protein [Desulfovibrio desulfuricans]